ncbi:MAG: DUF4293 domain-containing protein [Bacteroidetes bacterium]|nr:MAG: DUF4293 domain-containing protein [Bacteroidota bacterium]
MFQRIQTIWLLLAAACSFFTFKFPFYSGTKSVNGTVQSETVEPGSHLGLLIISVAVGVIALITIFIYKNRKLQFRLCMAGLLLSIGDLILYYSLSKSLENGVLAFWSIFAFAIPVFYFLAARGIYRDEKLVKSVDRLR